MRDSSTKKIAQRIKRRKFRNKVVGDKNRPRLSIFRSNKLIYVQIIDDSLGYTLVAASVKEIKDGKSKLEKAKLLGLLIAKKAKSKKVDKIVFDRGSYKYHGRIKAVVDGAKEGGLNF